MNHKFNEILVLDTNIILNDTENLFELSENGNNLLVLPETVLDELDAKKSGFEEINFQAREFGRLFETAEVLEVDRSAKHRISTHTHFVKDGRNVYVDVVSKTKYSSDNDTTIPASIRNDRKIIEIARDLTIEHKNKVTFLSLDTMCRHRALSLDVKVKSLSLSEDKQNILTFDLTVDDLQVDYKIFDIEKLDVPSSVQHLSLTDRNGKMAFYYKSGSLFLQIDEKELARQEVTPNNVGQKALSSMMLDEYYDVVVSNSPAGCVLPGVNIEILVEDKWLSDVNTMKVLNISRNELNILRLNNFINYKKINYKKIEYNLATFKPSRLKFLHIESNKKLIYHNDKKFESKYLKLDYWISTNIEIKEAIEKVTYIRKFAKFFDIEEENFIDYSQANLMDTIYRIQFKFLSFNYTSFQSLYESDIYITNINKKYWTLRGFSENEAKEKISFIQKNNSNKRFEKYSELEIKQQSKRSLEYWKLHYNIEEAKEKLKEHQTTFSLDICIDKYGGEGVEIWEDRQKKWQNTMTALPDEAKIEIKYKQASSNSSIYENWDEFKNKDGILYYIRFFNDDIEFWKIGITSKDIQARFGSKNVFKNRYNLDYEVIFENRLSVKEAFIQEQNVLKKFREFRQIIDYNGFNTTEAFTKDILCK